jgi:uncharacterized membrane protein YqhA
MCQFSVVVGVAVGTAGLLLMVGLTLFVIFFTKKEKKEEPPEVKRLQQAIFNNLSRKKFTKP